VPLAVLKEVKPEATAPKLLKSRSRPGIKAGNIDTPAPPAEWVAPEFDDST